MEGYKTMFELNEQELEQVAGGHGHYGAHAGAEGGASAVVGVAASSSEASSLVTHCFATAHAANDSAAAGFVVDAGSSASSGAGR